MVPNPRERTPPPPRWTGGNATFNTLVNAWDYCLEILLSPMRTGAGQGISNLRFFVYIVVAMIILLVGSMVTFVIVNNVYMKFATDRSLQTKTFDNLVVDKPKQKALTTKSVENDEHIHISMKQEFFSFTCPIIKHRNLVKNLKKNNQIFNGS